LKLDGAGGTPRPLLMISDLHLSEALPRTVHAFEHFVRVTANEADSVFILGDLFEYWVGDDMLDLPFARRMAALMHTLSERGIALYVMHGNRDFLLGKRFMATRCAPPIRPTSVSVALHAHRSRKSSFSRCHVGYA
jgi:UDP-2,3-diacylglucosamine hydrolase